MVLNNLKEKKIGKTAFDLKQKDIGSAQYAKNLIKVLQENDTEIFLITNIAFKRIKRNQNKVFFEKVSIANICHKLQKGSRIQRGEFKKIKFNKQSKNCLTIEFKLFDYVNISK